MLIDIFSTKQACVAKFTSGSSIGGCNGIDAKCICANPSFISGIACCLASACNPADQQTATTFALNFCKTVGVTGLPTVNFSRHLPASGLNANHDFERPSLAPQQHPPHRLLLPRRLLLPPPGLELPLQLPFRRPFPQSMPVLLAESHLHPLLQRLQRTQDLIMWQEWVLE